jgi:hypothetical protein
MALIICPKASFGNLLRKMRTATLYAWGNAYRRMVTIPAIAGGRKQKTLAPYLNTMAMLTTNLKHKYIEKKASEAQKERNLDRSNETGDIATSCKAMMIFCFSTIRRVAISAKMVKRKDHIDPSLTPDGRITLLL